MGLLSPGYWPTTYWAKNFWTDNYWPGWRIQYKAYGTLSDRKSATTIGDS